MRNPGPGRGVPSSVTDPAQAEGRELVARLRSADPATAEAAFEEIVQLHRRRLFGVALRRTGNPEIAEDAVQVALVQAWKHLPRMEGEIDLTAWLTTVVSNAAMDQIRRDRRHVRLAQRAFDAAPERAERRGTERTEESGGADVDRVDLGRVLLDGIRTLPEPYRVALDLFHVQGLSIDDISKALSLNENTVKSHLARGRALLRRKLGAQLERGGWA